jgi:hypothetical protein
MQEKSLIKKNILKFIDNKGISRYNFYKVTGITRGILDQNNGMSEENIARFLAVYGKEVSADWLFTGSGDPGQQKISPHIYKEVEQHSLSVFEPDIMTMALRETIEIQKKYISHLEKEVDKLKEKLEPAEDGQKRKAS